MSVRGVFVTRGHTSGRAECFHAVVQSAWTCSIAQSVRVSFVWKLVPVINDNSKQTAAPLEALHPAKKFVSITCQQCDPQRSCKGVQAPEFSTLKLLSIIASFIKALS